MEGGGLGLLLEAEKKEIYKFQVCLKFQPPCFFLVANGPKFHMLGRLRYVYLYFYIPIGSIHGIFTHLFLMLMKN